jgi:hypothetical protein
MQETVRLRHERTPAMEPPSALMCQDDFRARTDPHPRAPDRVARPGAADRPAARPAPVRGVFDAPPAPEPAWQGQWAALKYI